MPSAIVLVTVLLLLLLLLPLLRGSQRLLSVAATVTATATATTTRTTTMLAHPHFSPLLSLTSPPRLHTPSLASSGSLEGLSLLASGASASALSLSLIHI